MRIACNAYVTHDTRNNSSVGFLQKILEAFEINLNEVLQMGFKTIYKS